MITHDTMPAEIERRPAAAIEPARCVMAGQMPARRLGRADAARFSGAWS